MTPTRTRNPFKPGNGLRPPYLAGRENEQSRLREILADMADGEPPAADMLMYGPRGMGKTVLLNNWIARNEPVPRQHQRRRGSSKKEYCFPIYRCPPTPSLPGLSRAMIR